MARESFVSTFCVHCCFTQSQLRLIGIRTRAGATVISVLHAHPSNQTGELCLSESRAIAVPADGMRVTRTCATAAGMSTPERAKRPEPGRPK
jgi:hypothetical protein